MGIELDSLLTTNFPIVLSIIAIILSLLSEIRQGKQGNDDFSSDVHRQFSEMWFMMDETFIQYPELHKYFYEYNPGGEKQNKPSKEKTSDTIDFRNYLPDDEVNLERAICIAEKFRDVFQYSEHMAEKIIDNYPLDCASYVMYMQRIQSVAVYKKMLTLNHVEIENSQPIGSKLGDELVNKGYLIKDNNHKYVWANRI